MISSRSVVFASGIVLVLGFFLWTFPDDSGAPLEFHRATIETARTGDATALWLALPSSYQDDIDAMVQSFADKLNGYEDIYNRTFQFIGKLGQLLTEKREYFLRSPSLKKFLEEKTVAEKSLGAGGRTLDSISREANTEAEVDTPDVSQPSSESLSSFAADTFDLIQTLTNVIPTSSATNNGDSTLDPSDMHSIEESRLSVDRVEGNRATIRIEARGREPIRQIVVRVEGKWVPESLAVHWSTLVASVKRRLAALSLSEREKFAVSAFLSYAETAANNLIKANTQSEFDRRLAGLLVVIERL